MSTRYDSRSGFRRPAPKVEAVTIYPDPQDVPYDEVLATVAASLPVHSPRSVVAVVRDASRAGLGLRFEGQRIMARQLLRRGERYLLKLTFPCTDIARGKEPFLRREGRAGTSCSLVVKAVCRWYGPGITGNVGFALSGRNDPRVLAFLDRHFGEIKKKTSGPAPGGWRRGLNAGWEPPARGGAYT